MADCPRKKAADNRKRQEKDRRERQNQEAQRMEEQSSGKRRDRQSQDRVREDYFLIKDYLEHTAIRCGIVIGH